MPSAVLTYLQAYEFNTGRKPGIVGRRPTTCCAHSKITRVRVLSWPLPLRTTLYFLRVTEVLSPSDGSVAQNSAVIGQLMTQ